MKTLFSIVLIFSIAASGETPSQARITAAEKAVKLDPKQPQAYIELAAALCRRARETGDADYYTQAEQAAGHALRLAPGNFEAGKARVTALLGEGEFAKGRTEARALNRQVPDDLGGYALLVDANIALGNYPEAERAAQWILDLRVGSALAFRKAAELRQIFGDAEGAIDFMRETLRRTLPRDLEERAWILSKTAELQLSNGNPKEAAALLDEAFKLEPDYRPALLTLAQLRMLESNYAEAAGILDRAYRASRDPADLYEYAKAIDKGGRSADAGAALKNFAAAAEARSDKPLNANRELIFYYADYRNNPAEALQLATRESKIRHDVGTLDAYAWALYKNQQYEAARKEMDTALAVGVRDAGYFCHAARISIKTNDAPAAKKYERESTTLSPGACPADVAMSAKQDAGQ